MLTALGALLIAGLITAIPIGDGAPGRLSGYINPVPSTGAKGNDAFNRATSGDCLMWPERMPEAATVVDCKDEHRFEVAGSIDMSTFPGSEYGRVATPLHHLRPASSRSVRSSARPPYAATSAPRTRPEQQVQHQHAVVRRPGVASVG